MTDDGATEREKHTKRLKRRMECWREAVLRVHSVLLWEKSWYPGSILAVTTLVFLSIWYSEPAMLTTVAICLLIVALTDYLVPIFFSTFVSSSAWNGQKERKLEEICKNLSTTYLNVRTEWKLLLEARTDRPHMYYGSIILCSLLLAWIGNTVNNLLLTYLAVNGILLTPGLRRKYRGKNLLECVTSRITRRKS